MSLAPLQKCPHMQRSLLALLGTQAKCEIHLGGAGMRVGGVENVENWPFYLRISLISQHVPAHQGNEMVALYYEY